MSTASTLPPRTAFQHLRRGALYNLVSVLIAVAAAVIMAGSIIALFSQLGSESPVTGKQLTAPLAGIALGAVILLVAVIVYIVGWLKFNTAASLLAEYSEAYRIGYTGTRLFLISLVVEVIGILVLIAAAFAGISAAIVGGLVVIGLGLLLQLIGMILFAVMLMRLREVEGRFRTGGLLLLIGVILYIIGVTAVIGLILILVGYFLVYSAAGRVLERAASQATQQAEAGMGGR